MSKEFEEYSDAELASAIAEAVALELKAGAERDGYSTWLMRAVHELDHRINHS